MARKLTQYEVIQQFINKHGDTYIYDKVNYINEKTKVWIGCRVEGHGYFEQNPSKHKRGQQCPKCFGNKKIEQDEIIKQFKEKHGNKYIYDRVEYINNVDKVWIGCKVGNHGYFEQSPISHKRGSGCPRCDGKIVSDTNMLSILRPDLIKYFSNPKDANLYTISSDKKVILTCPECNMDKNKGIKISDLSKYGFSCDYCSNNISLPERFGIVLLKQLNINFETQKIFDWAKDKKYDICFTIDNDEFICEAHGLQHYEETTRGRSLKDEQESDQLKYDLAIQNGIKPENYIIIDCRYSEFEWLKDNYIKRLEDILDLINVDWRKLWEECQSSIKNDIWNYWNNKLEGDTSKIVGEIFGLCSSTIIKYLKIGNSIGKCKYSADDEIKKCGSKFGKMKSKIVYQYDMNENFVNSFESCAEVKRKLNIGHVSACCKGNRKTAGGFKWSYEKLH